MREVDEELIKSGRANLINAIIDYSVGFRIDSEEDVTEEMLQELENSIIQLEAIVPVFISLYEASQRITGETQTFWEWLSAVIEARGADFGGKI